MSAPSPVSWEASTPTPAPPPATAATRYHTVGDGDTIAFGRVKGVVLTTPGHTPDGTCLLLYAPADAPAPRHGSEEPGAVTANNALPTRHRVTANVETTDGFARRLRGEPRRGPFGPQLQP